MCWKLNTKFCAKLADYVRKFAAADGWSVRSEVPGGRGNANIVNMWPRGWQRSRDWTWDPRGISPEQTWKLEKLSLPGTGRGQSLLPGWVSAFL